MVNFAFNNPEVISAMRKRGDAIKAEDWETVDKIERNALKVFE